MKQRGFTLLELIVVIAITLILLGLLFGPLIQGLGVTRRARAIAVAQDSARNGIQQLRRELSQAAYIFDNTNQTIYLPIQATRTADPNRLPASLLGSAPPTDFRYPLSYAKIDFVPVARAKPNGVQILDPTTGRYINGTTGAVGTNLRFPLAPGTRLVRYFVGLRRNYVVTGGVAGPAYYQNPYEFPRAKNNTDRDFNPFILYRAEFDPKDANLINQTLTDPTDPTANAGGINDPNFFYNVAGTGANGKTYAENWAKIAQPMMDSQNMDLLVVRRTAIGAIDINNPFRTLVTFQPTTVSGDTATPGFLTSDASEVPGAVPTMYTAKYAHWTLPFTVTFVRASTTHTPDTAPGGSLSVRVTSVDQGGKQVLDVEPLQAVTGTGYGNGSLNMANLNHFYCTLSPTTGQYFIKTPDLAFAIDPARGRIITGFPPLAGDSAGATAGAIYVSLNNGAPQRVKDAGTVGTPYNPMDTANNTYGDLIPTVFRINTLDSFSAGTNPYPSNQGFLNVHLLVNQDDNPTNPKAGSGANYYTDFATALGTPDAAGTFGSPLAIFGAGANNPGVLVATGTERVTGPDSNVPAVAGNQSGNPLASYLRLPLSDYAPTQPTVPVSGAAPGSYASFTWPSPSYHFDYDIWPYDNLVFATAAIPGTVPGLPAATSGTTKELRATYLWQNNYARVTVGAPGKTYAIDANGNYSDDPDPSKQNMGPIEADVVKLDYATRSTLSVNVGVRIFDAQSGAPQQLQLNDKIQINNLGR